MIAIDKPQIEAIRAVLADKQLRHGVGDFDSMCSVAAMNIGLTGRAMDRCPECMSKVIHSWVIAVQDAMPVEMINSPEWKSLLPFAAGTGTGNGHEKERADLAMNWLWAVVLPSIQHVADVGGFGPQWSAMCIEKTESAAYAAAYATDAAAYATAYAAYAARAAAYATDAATDATFWQTISPAALLREMILVSVTEEEMSS